MATLLILHYLKIMVPKIILITVEKFSKYVVVSQFRLRSLPMMVKHAKTGYKIESVI